MAEIRTLFRRLKKQRFYTNIHLAGLSLGLASFFLIMLYVGHERSFDRFNNKSGKIYRLISSTSTESRAMVPYKWGEVLKDEWREVERLVSIQNITIALTVRKNGEVHAQHGFVGTDSTFLDIFDFPVIRGEKRALLRQPGKMVITPAMAAKYFSGEDPLGKTLEVNLWGTYVNFEVEGIVDCPDNSHLQFGFLIPIETVKKYFFNPRAFGSWEIHFAHTYILLKQPVVYPEEQSRIVEELKNFLERHGGKELSEKYTPDLEPLEDIYLKSNLQFDFQPRGNIRHLRILTAVAFGVLLMSVFNFINIATAQVLSRWRETGLKKVLGSGKIGLITEFIMESLAISFISLAIACISIVFVLPYYNNFTGWDLRLSALLNTRNTVLFTGTAFCTGMISGIYPAVVLSSFRPLYFLKSSLRGNPSGISARKILVVGQFVLTGILLIAAGVVYEQVIFLQHRDPGFDKDQVVIMDDARAIASDPAKTRLFREALSKFQEIQRVSASSSYPGQQSWAARYLPEGFGKEEGLSIATIYADQDFAETYDLHILMGRDFDPLVASDSTAYMINEAALRLFSSKDPSWANDPLTKKLYSRRDVTGGKVIGVVRDFTFESPEVAVAPLVFFMNTANYFAIQVKLNTQDMPGTLAKIERTWKNLFPETPFTYRFLDQEYTTRFLAEIKLGQILGIFSVLSIAVAILGLLGLASFFSAEKARELSIRKVIGATEIQLAASLTWAYLRLVLFAELLAVPAGYLLMNKWLESFAYRIDIPIRIILAATGLCFLVTVLTICYHSLKTAMTNPARVLSSWL